MCLKGFGVRSSGFWVWSRASEFGIENGDGGGQVRGVNTRKYTFTQIGFRRLSTSGDVRISARTLSIITLLAIVLIGAIGWGSYSLYRTEKQRRIIRNARTSLEKHATEEAWFWASQALQNKQDGVEETRLMADIAQTAGSPEAIFWCARVASLEPKLLQNYLAWAKTALGFGNPVAARYALDAAPKEAQQNASWHSLCAGLASNTGQSSAAEFHFAEAARLQPQNPIHEVNLSTFRLSSSDPKVAEDARKSLESKNADPAVQLLVWRALLNDGISRNDLAFAETYQKRLWDDPSAEFGDKANCLEVARRNGSLQPFLEQLQKEVSNQAEQATLLIYWMTNHGLAAEAIKWADSVFPPRTAKLSVQIAIADTLLQEKNWPELRDRIGGKNWKQFEFIRQAMLVRTDREQDLPTWRADWMKLVQSLPAVGGKLPLGRLAESWGWTDDAVGLYWQVADASALEKPEALARLWTIYQRDRNTAGLLRVATKQHEASPEDLVARNNYAFLLLLLDVDRQKAVRLAEESANQAPNQPNVAATLAFARLHQGNPELARRILEKFDKQTLEDPGLALYYAISLDAVHQSEKALHYAQIAERSRSLLPEEASLARRIIDASHR
jgi:Flp pilus assembly protein TadD